jgi:tetratricopeptide (TPR) repeat protein/two-component sensor histidine kinase
MRYLLPTVLLSVLSLRASSQPIDPLWLAWQDKERADTSRCNAMIVLIQEHYLRNRPDTAATLATELLDLANRTGSERHQAKATLLLAAANKLMNNYDVAIQAYRRAHELNRRIDHRPGMAKSLQGIATCLREQGSMDSADIYLDSAEHALAGIHDREMESRIADDRGLAACLRGDLESALRYWHETLAMHEAAQERNSMAAMLGKLGVVHQLRGDHRRAIDNYYRSLAIMEELNDMQGVGATCGNLGHIHLEHQEFDIARGYFERALEVARSISDRRAEADALNNLGVLCSRNGDHTKASTFDTQALAIRREIKDLPGEINSLHNLAEVSRDAGDLVHAQELYLECLSKLDITGDQRALTNTLVGLTSVFNLQDDHATAVVYGTRALGLAQRFGYLTEARNVTSLLHTSHKALRNTEQALLMLELHMAAKDSLASSEDQRMLLEREFQYTYEKETLADSLRHAAELVHVRDQQHLAETRSLATGGGAALVLLGGGLWFHADRKRRKARFEKEAATLETQALRSQMNPHFIFNALNSINAYVQQNDQESASSYLTKFARVMRSVLENSRHSEVPLQDDLDTLRGYMELERKRSHEKFDFTINLDPSLDPAEVMVPPLVVQPFVENAIWHGMAGKEGKGHITLSVKQHGKQLLWTIEDDGAGRHAPKVGGPENAPTKKTSLGTAITRSRLDLVQKQHGGTAGFQYVDLTQGTRVEVNMPLIVNA